MEFMKFVRCSKHETLLNCCVKNMTTESEKETDESNYENLEFTERKHTTRNLQSAIKDTSKSTSIEDDCYENSKIPLPWTSDERNSIHVPFSELSYSTMNGKSLESIRGNIFSYFKTEKGTDLRCPRCGKRMQEPRLLPCLHPICSLCIFEVMNKSFCKSSTSTTHGAQVKHEAYHFNETCSICDFQLPNAKSTTPPPYYPLQHRLVMNAMRCRLANRILCDVCSDEVIAIFQCSTCLRHFCADCGLEHQQELSVEVRSAKHTVRPLWEATKLRRTTLCQKHPAHVLRFYCIACQQVTCKECMWSTQHRGHASEDATGAGKRAALYLTTMSERAKTLLNILLTQYDRNAFSNNNPNEIQETFVPPDHSYSTEHLKAGMNYQKCSRTLTHAKQAEERIQEFNRLQRARYLLDAISLINELITDGSDVEILTLINTIINRLKILGVLNITLNKKFEDVYTDVETLTSTPMHTGIYHCCTFCSSGGKKEVICGCGGTMPGGYWGCGHGHVGHPGVSHWSCCGSVLRYGPCFANEKVVQKLLF